MGERGNQEHQESSTSRGESRSRGATQRALVVHRKARYRGPWGRIQRAFRDQRSPLITVAFLVAAIGVMAGVMYLIGKGGI